MIFLWKSDHHKTYKWAASSEFGTYRLCEQRRFRRACASAQSRQNLRCSLIQAVSQEEPSDRKPDPWPLWMTGHAQLKFVMAECSKTQLRLTGLKWYWNDPINHALNTVFTPKNKWYEKLSGAVVSKLDYGMGDPGSVRTRAEFVLFPAVLAKAECWGLLIFRYLTFSHYLSLDHSLPSIFRTFLALVIRYFIFCSYLSISWYLFTHHQQSSVIFNTFWNVGFLI